MVPFGILSETLYCECVLLCVRVISLQIIQLEIALKFVHLIPICLDKCLSKLVFIVAMQHKILGLKISPDFVFKNAQLLVLLITTLKDVLQNVLFLNLHMETSLLIVVCCDALLILHSGLITQHKPVCPYALAILMVLL
jgi:hypothetical protein